MTIVDALRQLRNDLKDWCITNFNNKLNKNLGGDAFANRFVTTDSQGNVTASSYEVIPIAKGGTGIAAQNVEEIRNAIGAAPKYELVTSLPSTLQEGVLYFVYEE